MDNNSKESKQSFFQKFKNDKKYRAKVQLIGYTVFIVFLIVFINVSNVGNNYSYNSVDNNNLNTNNDNEVKKKEVCVCENLFQMQFIMKKRLQIMN